MKNFKLILLFGSLMFFTLSNLHSQSEKIILYNSQPVKVELSDSGQILSFIGLVPGYMDGYDLSTEPGKVIAMPTKVEEPIIPVSAKNALYDVVSNEREELEYKPNFATLDKTIINKLNAIAAKLNADPNTKILLTAHKASLESNRLTANRLASAIAYLGLKGVSAERIQTEILKNENLHDVIAVNYFN
jgi:outer membrane protein OmpA-like peptidoglycan-associated protein